jgi:hypothetical protein
MLQTITETKSTTTRSKMPPKKSALETVFDVIREELGENGGEAGAAFEVALDHIKSKRLYAALFDERGVDIVRGLWNQYAGGQEESEQEYPEPPKQIKGVRAQLRRYTPGGAFDKWVPLGCTGKSKLIGDLTEDDVDTIIKAYDSVGTNQKAARQEQKEACSRSLYRGRNSQARAVGAAVEVRGHCYLESLSESAQTSEILKSTLLMSGASIEMKANDTMGTREVL